MSSIVISQKVQSWSHGGSAATLKIYATEPFRASDGTFIKGGKTQSDNLAYDEIACSVSGGNVTIPQTTIYSTDDSRDRPDVRYNAILFDDNGTYVEDLLLNFILPSAIDSPTTWDAIAIYGESGQTVDAADYLTQAEADAAYQVIDADLTAIAALSPTNDDILQIKAGAWVNRTPLQVKDDLNFGYYSLTDYASLSSALTAIGSTSGILKIDNDVTVSTAITIPSTLQLDVVPGKLFTKSGSGTITFQGVGLVYPDSKTAIFSGFAAGDVLWNGSNYPHTITSSLWADTDLSDKLLRAFASMDGNKVTVKAFPGNLGSQWTLPEFQNLYLTRGEYPCTIDAQDQTLFTLESNTVVYGDGMGQTILYESSALTRNVRLFRSSGGNDGFNENIEVRDLEVRGHANQAWFDNGPTTILLGNCTNGHIRRVKFKDTHAYGAFFGGFRNLGFYPKECSITDCYFDHVIAQNCGILNGVDCRIERNTFVNLGADASDPGTVAIDVEPNSSDETVENVIVKDNLIDARGAQQVVNGIIVQYGGSENGISSGEISGNRIIGYDISAGTTDRNVTNGITLTGGYGVTVANNVVQGTLQSAYYFTNGRYLHVHNNRAMDTGAAGVYAFRVESIADSDFFGNITTKRSSGFVGTDDSITELATSQPATSSASTITTQSFVLPHWAGLTVTFNATDYTVSTVTDFSHFTTTVAVGTVTNASVASATDINTGTDVITANSHGFNNNAIVRIVTGGTIPGGLTNGDSYYVVNKTANTFQLSLTSGGAAIDITSTGTGTQSIQPMLVTKFGNNAYVMNRRGSVALLNGSTEYSKATDQVATLTDSQTLTNKTLTSPAITTPTGIVKGDVGLGNVENTALSTWAGSTNLITAGALGATSLNLGGATLLDVLSATAALNFDLSASATQDLTITVTGAALGDAVILGIQHGSVTTDTLFNAWVSGADTVTVRATRISGTPDPASGTFRAVVLKF